MGNVFEILFCHFLHKFGMPYFTERLHIIAVRKLPGYFDYFQYYLSYFIFTIFPKKWEHSIALCQRYAYVVL